MRWVFTVLMVQYIDDAFAKNYNDAFEVVKVMYSMRLASVQDVVFMHIDMCIFDFYNYFLF